MSRSKKYTVPRPRRAYYKNAVTRLRKKAFTIDDSKERLEAFYKNLEAHGVYVAIKDKRPFRIHIPTFE
jgi:hypothetical protein